MSDDRNILVYEREREQITEAQIGVVLNWKCREGILTRDRN